MATPTQNSVPPQSPTVPRPTEEKKAYVNHIHTGASRTDGGEREYIQTVRSLAASTYPFASWILALRLWRSGQLEDTDLIEPEADVTDEDSEPSPLFKTEEDYTS